MLPSKTSRDVATGVATEGGTDVKEDEAWRCAPETPELASASHICLGGPLFSTGALTLKMGYLSESTFFSLLYSGTPHWAIMAAHSTPYYHRHMPCFASPDRFRTELFKKRKEGKKMGNKENQKQVRSYFEVWFIFSLQ